MHRALETLQWVTLCEWGTPRVEDLRSAIDAYGSLTDDQRERCRQAGLRVSRHFAKAADPLHLPADPFAVLLAGIAKQHESGDGISVVENRDPESVRCDLDRALWHLLYVITAREPFVHDVLVQRASSCGATVPDLEDGVATISFLAQISGREALDEETYQFLSDADVASLIDWIVRLIQSPFRDRSWHRIGDTLCRVNCLRPKGLNNNHVKVARTGWFSGAEMYYGADAQTRDEIITPSTRQVITAYDHPDVALAMIGDAVVQGYFRAQSASDAAWYPPFGGWELTDDGGRRDLHFGHGFSLVSGPDDVADSPVRVFHPDAQPSDAPRPLNLVVELNPSDERLAFLGLSGNLVRFATSTAWEKKFFTRIDTSGNVTAHPCSPWPEAKEDAAWHVYDAPLGLGAPLLRPVTPLQRLESSASHIGGLPRWLQRPAYPVCPDCDRRMMFVAQICGAAPTLYACICRECMVAAVVTQFD